MQLHKQSFKEKWIKKLKVTVSHADYYTRVQYSLLTCWTAKKEDIINSILKSKNRGSETPQNFSSFGQGIAILEIENVLIKNETEQAQFHQTRFLFLGISNNILELEKV